MRRLVLLCVCALAVCAAGVQAADPVFPDVTYIGFDANTFTYTYQIDCPADSTYPFGQLTVQAEVPNFGIYFPWALAADTFPSTLWNKGTTVREWIPTRKDNAYWRAATTADVVPSATAWSGRFTLVVPNSSPTGGLVVTMDGGPVSTQVVERTVPGPALIPEPGSLLALGGLLGGLLPMIRRRK